MSAQPSDVRPGRDTRVIPAPRVVAEAGDWIVVDKPAHMQAHPSKPGDDRTLWHAMRELLAYELANGGQVSIVNRLDRETSGLTLIAKSRVAASHFCRTMERGGFAKEYLALVWGWPAWDQHEIDAPLLRQGSRMASAIYLKQCVHPDGAPAATLLAVERRFRRDGQPFALIRARPRTGRMHQIRVHLAHAGHPLVGDKIYGPSERHYLEFIETGWTPSLAAALLLPRHALHSTALAVPDEGLRWEAPLPDDMEEFMEFRI